VDYGAALLVEDRRRREPRSVVQDRPAEQDADRTRVADHGIVVVGARGDSQGAPCTMILAQRGCSRAEELLEESAELSVRPTTG
jgi:hypothetical protein